MTDTANGFDFLEQVGGYTDDSNLGMDGLQKNLMPLFLILDTSGSMAGQKIQQVESAIEEIKMQLSLLNAKNDDADIKISILRFDTNVRWEGQMQDPALINPDLTLGVLTNMGAAFIELEKMLSRKQLIQKGQCAGYKRAVLILLTDGLPTDDVDEGIRKLRTNNWFVKGTRIGFAIGDDADTECLKKFTGNSETVLQLNNINLLSEILSNVAVVASTTATHAPGLSTDDAATQQQKDEEFNSSASNTTDILKSAFESQVVGGNIDPDDASNIFAGWTL